METKERKYMQRIEKIMSTPTRTISPLRPTKSPIKCRTNQLDQYLKYELSAKIISNFINKHRQQLIQLFFSLLRRSQNRQKERIYKFVAIEKKEMKVDFGISAKLMVSAIKQIYKNRFTHFLQRIPNHHLSVSLSNESNSQEERSVFKKNKEQTMKSAVLIRTASRPDAKNYKEVSEWNYDGESSKGKQLNYDKYQQMKIYILKALLKLVYSKIKTVQSQAMKRLHHNFWVVSERKKAENKIIIKQKNNNNVEQWKQKEESLKREVADLQTALIEAKNDSQKCYIECVNANNELKVVEQKIENLWQSKLKMIVHARWIQDKIKIIQEIKSVGFLLRSNQQKEIVSLSKGSSISHLHQFYINFQRKSFELIRNYEPLIEQIKVSPIEGNHMFYAIQNIIFRKYQVSLMKIALHATSNKKQMEKMEQIRNIQIQQSSMPDFVDLPISNRAESLQQPSNSMMKINFYLFADKIFKLLLVISKLLIPIKEAFGKIDQYASYSYRIEESFKTCYLPRVNQAFQTLKSIKKQQKPTVQMISNVLDKIIKEFYIEPFSCIKIYSRENDLKIKVFPVRSTIVESTKLFLEERNIYSIYSQDYWSKVRQNKFEDIQGNPEKESFSKKRSNTTF